MAWWLERKTGQQRGLNGQGPNDNAPTKYATNKKTPNDATTSVWFYVRPLPQPQETPAKQTPPPRNNNLRATPESSPAETVPEDHESHKNHAPAKGVCWFSRLSVCTHNLHKPRIENPDLPEKTWEQGCTMQDARNARRNHTPALAGRNTTRQEHPRMKPSNGNAWHEAAGALNEPHTRFGGCVAILGTSTARYPPDEVQDEYERRTTAPKEQQKLLFWCLLPPCVKNPHTKYGGIAPDNCPLQKIMPETGWAAV
ncbi:hypothetical protein BS47DRAFT_1369007 [Hydnum rufescens UP504]|uniref:Uncharacterized protein n=1 Tax=Hydnum rufescens UP504 TaxID=1448309 RepID=A0A9P6AE23_9AGAM|nr:hypothetical protein BS47DRAFT_1369007 [Hydnum rufescens UP504]